MSISKTLQGFVTSGSEGHQNDEGEPLARFKLIRVRLPCALEFMERTRPRVQKSAPSRTSFVCPLTIWHQGFASDPSRGREGWHARAHALQNFSQDMNTSSWKRLHYF